MLAPCYNFFILWGDFMTCVGSVVHAQSFVSKASGKTFTKLFVPVGFDLVTVIANGDLTALSGVEGVPFRVGIKDNQLKLYYDGEED